MTGLSAAAGGRSKALAEQAQQQCRQAWQARERGDEAAAATAFLEALASDHACREALRALHYNRWSDAVLVAALPTLERLAAEGGGATGGVAPALLTTVHADWHYRVGDRSRALAYYRSQWGSPWAPCSGAPAASGDSGSPAPAAGRPDALLIGAPKCGTTSLLAYLRGHPRLWVHPRKELHFFDSRWDWGVDWYWSQFPPRPPGREMLRLEGTPNYLQHPEIPERVQTLLPEARLLVLLREPLERAVSWLHHQRRWGGLQEPIEVVLRRELEELLAMGPEQRRGLGWRHPNALAGSLYAQQLARWRERFPDGALLCLRFEDLRRHPAGSCRRALEFLNLDPDDLSLDGYPVFNAAPEAYRSIDPGLARACREDLLTEAMQIWTEL